MYLPAAAVYEVCFAILLLLQLLLLAAAVRHRVLDGKKCCFGSLHLIAAFSVSSFKHDLFSVCPLVVLSHLQRHCLPRIHHIPYIIGVTGIRGA